MVHESADAYNIRGCPVPHCNLETQHFEKNLHHQVYKPTQVSPKLSSEIETKSVSWMQLTGS